MAFHGTISSAEDLHRAYAWEYADATARTAAVGFTVTDVGKGARQLDNNSIWMLTDDSPITWVQVGGPVAGYTNEQAQDAVGAILTDSASIDFTYDDAANTITAAASTALRTTTLNVLIDGGGSAITTGVKADLALDFAGTITAWTLLGDTSGSLVLDLWKDTYANYPPTVADTITGAEKPTISAATKGQDTSLAGGSGWAVAAGDIIRVNVDSASTITRATLALTVVRT
ncbi:MAG TPA: hypothetical protein VH475_26515 [Tepidisphaeraceae bacterium]